MFATRLKELRMEKGYTVEAMSKMLNVSNVTFYRYESGARNPNSDTISKISGFFDVSIDYLFGKTNEKIRIDNSDIIDVKYKIDTIICELESSKPLLFDGEILNKDANISLILALKIGMGLVYKSQKKIRIGR